ncbi:hypothetical protein KKD80_01890 [Patescibacteria group bacterium]|nr:hypothetical protein [Patescibacteria group bacterium]
MTRGTKHDALFAQFQRLQMDNPEILTIINQARIKNLALTAGDFLESMRPLFDGLRFIANSLGSLPSISASSAERAWEELHNAPSDALDEEMFDRFRDVIEMEFKPSVKKLVLSSEVKQRIERTFAIILRAIQDQLIRNAVTR